jgi:hypothetical protein
MAAASSADDELLPLCPFPRQHGPRRSPDRPHAKSRRGPPRRPVSDPPQGDRAASAQPQRSRPQAREHRREQAFGREQEERCVVEDAPVRRHVQGHTEKGAVLPQRLQGRVGLPRGPGDRVHVFCQVCLRINTLLQVPVQQQHVVVPTGPGCAFWVKCYRGLTPTQHPPRPGLQSRHVRKDGPELRCQRGASVVRARIPRLLSSRVPAACYCGRDR